MSLTSSGMACIRGLDWKVFLNRAFGGKQVSATLLALSAQQPTGGVANGHAGSVGGPFALLQSLAELLDPDSLAEPSADLVEAALNAVSRLGASTYGAELFFADAHGLPGHVATLALGRAGELHSTPAHRRILESGGLRCTVQAGSSCWSKLQCGHGDQSMEFSCNCSAGGPEAIELNGQPVHVTYQDACHMSGVAAVPGIVEGVLLGWYGGKGYKYQFWRSLLPSEGILCLS